VLKSVETAGVVVRSFPNATFGIRFDDGQEAIAHVSGKIRLNRIKILVGDRVLVTRLRSSEASGRIVYRYKA